MSINHIIGKDRAVAVMHAYTRYALRQGQWRRTVFDGIGFPAAG